MNDSDPVNPPAFPCNLAYWHGMTLRDYFAGQAMQGLLAADGGARLGANLGPTWQADVAATAYRLADEMLAARRQEGDQP